MSGPLRRVREWWHRRRRGRGVLEPAGGPDEDDLGGAGVREPRRPRPPHLEGGVALEEPRSDEGEKP